MQKQALPVLPHQKTALTRAREALDAIKPHSAHDLTQAFSRDPSRIGEAAGGQTRRSIRAMQFETELRTNPALRADRFVQRWQALDTQRQQLALAGDFTSRRAVTGSMGELAKDLQRDPQLDSLLRGRAKELGLPTMSAGSVSRQLTRQLGLGRERGIGIAI